MVYSRIYVRGNQYIGQNEVFRSFGVGEVILSFFFKFSMFLFSKFRRLTIVVFFVLDDSLLSEFYVPTFRNTLSFPSS